MRTPRKTALALLIFATSACDNADFAGDVTSVQDYKVKVGESSGAEEGTESPSSDAKPSSTNARGSDPKAECAQLTGVDHSRIKVAGSENEIVVSKSEALLFHVTGNKNVVNVDLKNAEASSEIKAICIFIAGNQNKVSLAIGNQIGNLLVIARGNQPEVKVATAAGSSINKISWDSKGNGGIMEISGEGKFPCDKADKSMSCE